MSIRKIWDEITRRRWEGEELFFFFFGKLVHVLPRSLLLLLFVARGLGGRGRNEVESDRNNGSARHRGGRKGGLVVAPHADLPNNMPTKRFSCRQKILERETVFFWVQDSKVSFTKVDFAFKMCKSSNDDGEHGFCPLLGGNLAVWLKRGGDRKAPISNSLAPLFSLTPCL